MLFDILLDVSQNGIDLCKCNCELHRVEGAGGESCLGCVRLR
jgi:hypothetical protein